MKLQHTHTILYEERQHTPIGKARVAAIIILMKWKRGIGEGEKGREAEEQDFLELRTKLVFEILSIRHTLGNPQKDALIWHTHC